MLFCTIDMDSELDGKHLGRDSKIEEALRFIAEGKTECIADIYDETKSALYGYILAIIKNPDDVEDVLQDTYVKICGCAGMYKPQGKPMAWIFTIARNLALMEIRAKNRIGEMDEYEWSQLSVESQAVTVEDRMVLSVAMKSLTDDECQIVMLHAVGGMKHREIADMYDMPLATVLSKYNRAIKKLQKKLEQK